MKNEKSNSQFEIKEKKQQTLYLPWNWLYQYYARIGKKIIHQYHVKLFGRKKNKKKGKNQTNQSISHFFSGQSSNGNT